MVEDVNTAELIAVSKSNSASGKVPVKLPAGRTYSVSANKEGFFFHSELLTYRLQVHHGAKGHCT